MEEEFKVPFLLSDRVFMLGILYYTFWGEKNEGKKQSKGLEKATWYFFGCNTAWFISKCWIVSQHLSAFDLEVCISNLVSRDPSKQDKDKHVKRGLFSSPWKSVQQEK